MVPHQTAEASVLVALIIIAFVIGGVVKGVIGVGMPTVAMGVLSLGLPPAQAAAIAVLPIALSNVWQALAGPALARLAKRFALALIAIALGTFLAIGILTASSARSASALLGAVLASYGTYGLAAPRMTISEARERVLSPVVGAVTGLLNGATGIFIFPVAPFLGSLRLEKEELIQALALVGIVCPLALTAALLRQGSFQHSSAGWGLFAVLPALAGMYAGQLVRGRLSQAVFKQCFFFGLLVLGSLMLLRGFGGR